jgi:Neuraminidase (sialidase)
LKISVAKDASTNKGELKQHQLNEEIKFYIKQNCMEKIIVEMTKQEFKRFESYKQADKIVRSIKRSLKDIELSNTGVKKLKSARQLINEI